MILLRLFYTIIEWRIICNVYCISHCCVNFFCINNVVGILETKKRKDIIITEKIRCKDYIESSVLLWGAVLAVFIMCLIGNISFADIGLRFINFDHNIWFTIITFIFSGMLFVFILYQIIFSLVNKNFREKSKKQVIDGIGASDRIPRTQKERRLWFLLAFSAGVCEEIIYRGFLVFLLQAIFPGISIIFIILITFVTFGVGHLSQGLQGAIFTGILGALFMCLFIVTDSLLLPMLLHFLFDLQSTFVFLEEKA